jgi:orotate phosphoribosyltransferase-like protein
MGYSKPLNSDDWKLVRSAADDGTTTKDFADEMNLSENDVWTYLNSKNGEYYGSSRISVTVLFA